MSEQMNVETTMDVKTSRLNLLPKSALQPWQQECELLRVLLRRVGAILGFMIPSPHQIGDQFEVSIGSRALGQGSHVHIALMKWRVTCYL